MNGFLRSHLPARDLDRTIRDDLVGIHICLRARTCLPNAKRKMLVQFALDHFVSRLDNEILFLFRQLAELVVNDRSGFLQEDRDEDCGHLQVGL